VLRVVGVHDGASLAGNDSSAASCTRSWVFRRLGKAARSRRRWVSRCSTPVVAHQASALPPSVSSNPSAERRRKPVMRSAPAITAASHRSVSHSRRSAPSQMLGSPRCWTRFSVIKASARLGATGMPRVDGAGDGRRFNSCRLNAGIDEVLKGFLTGALKDRTETDTGGVFKEHTGAHAAARGPSSREFPPIVIRTRPAAVVAHRLLKSGVATTHIWNRRGNRWQPRIRRLTTYFGGSRGNTSRCQDFD
jgi:hypothetical protein